MTQLLFLHSLAKVGIVSKTQEGLDHSFIASKVVIQLELYGNLQFGFSYFFFSVSFQLKNIQTLQLIKMMKLLLKASSFLIFHYVK